MNIENVSAAEALERLKKGNREYLDSRTGTGDISPEKRSDTYRNGQQPYAVIIGCSDSRVIPESIFSAGIGELFVIRVAGNVIDYQQLGSIEYAAEHLGCKLAVVLGHDQCGAVNAAIHQKTEGYVKFITDEIKKAIDHETDDLKASRLNVRRSVKLIKRHIGDENGVTVVGAIYHTEDGRVEFDI